MAEKINIGARESLREGAEKINQAIDEINQGVDTANQAKTESTEALSTANNAKTTADSVQEQFNQVVIEGDSSVEAAQARVDLEGNSYTTLKERLDTEHSQVTSELAQKATLDDLSKTNENISNIEIYEYGGKIGTKPNKHIAHHLVIPTYEGSGQAVHPDVINIPGGFGSEGWKFWMAMTPYPSGNSAQENPSILASHDKVNWEVPGNLINPIIAKPPGTSDHNSDPVLVFINNELHLFYRETIKSVTPIKHTIYLITSTDGENWSTPITILEDTSGKTDGLMSPTILIENGTWKMWVVDGWGNLVKKTSADGKVWSADIVTTTIGMPFDRNYWHVDVERNGERLEMMLCSSTDTGGANTRLHHAYSIDDGVTWYVSEGFFIDQLYWFEGSLQYRASIVKGEGNLFDIYYSCMSGDSIWSIAYMQAIYINEKLIPLYPSDYRNEVKQQDLRGKGAWLLTDTEVAVDASTNVAIPFRTPVYDDLGFRTLSNPSRITIPQKVKKVRITAGISLTTNSNGTRRLFLAKNGNTSAPQVIVGSWFPAHALNVEMNISSPVLNVNEGDYFQVYVWQNSGTILSVERVNRTFVSVEVIE